MHEVEVKVILSAQNGMNIYRGCSHGCIYCDSRSKCYQIHHDFEDIEVKSNAPILLENALRRKRKKCMIGTGAMSDSYIHLEERLGNTRKCLELIESYGFGLAIQTKSSRILPFINDTEENIRGILNYCIEAKVHGIICFGMGLTLREGNREYFYKKLDEHFPRLKARYINTYCNSYEVVSPNNNKLMAIFRQECISHNIIYDPNKCFSYLHEFEEKDKYDQLTLF